MRLHENKRPPATQAAVLELQTWVEARLTVPLKPMAAEARQVQARLTTQAAVLGL